VNYFEKDAVREFKRPQWNEETKKMETITVQEIYDKLLFCQRLEWQDNEDELDSYIEEVRSYWENRINS
jgi:hypothetical protein